MTINSSSPIPMTQTIDSPVGNDLFEVMSSIDVNNPENTEAGDESEVSSVEEGSGEKAEGLEKEGKEKVGAESSKEEKAATPKEPPPKAKVLTAFSGDEEIQIPEDAVVRIPVDGKEVEVSIQDLKKDYQGRIPWSKHYAESKKLQKDLEIQKAELEGQKNHQESRLNEILETFDKNPYLAFEKIAILKGKNPADYLPVYIAQSKKTLEELAKLSDAEYRALIIAKGNEHRENLVKADKEKFESERTAFSKQKEVAEADQYFYSKAQEFKFTEDEIKVAVEVVNGSGQDLSKLPPKEVADLLVNYIENIERPFSNIEAACREIDENLVSDREFIGNLKNLITKDFTKDDIKSIILEYKKESIPSPGSKVQAQSVGSSKNGSKPQSVKANKGKIARKKEETKVGVNGDSEVGPMSMWDILKDYD